MRHCVTILSGSAVLLTIATQSAFALPAYSFQRAELFAVCSGRLAALATHQKSVRNSHAPDSQRLQEEFEILLDAVTPDAVDQGMPWGQPVRWRSQGWSEIAGFLADMQYSFDVTVAELASDAAEQRIDQCRNLLLPPDDNG